MADGRADLAGVVLNDGAGCDAAAAQAAGADAALRVAPGVLHRLLGEHTAQFARVLRTAD